ELHQLSTSLKTWAPPTSHSINRRSRNSTTCKTLFWCCVSCSMRDKGYKRAPHAPTVVTLVAYTATNATLEDDAPHPCNERCSRCDKGYKRPHRRSVR